MNRTFDTPGLGSGGGLGASESPSTIFTKQYSINAMNTNLNIYLTSIYNRIFCVYGYYFL